jgi:hypothetical protein
MGKSYNKPMNTFKQFYNESLEPRAKGYKANFDHIKVDPYVYDETDKQTIFRVREYTKDNELLAIYFYRRSPEAFNDEQSMVLNSTDLTNILPNDIKELVRKEVQEYEINKYNVDQDVKDVWKGAVAKL